jgi:hypothetical protein
MEEKASLEQIEIEETPEFWVIVCWSLTVNTFQSEFDTPMFALIPKAVVEFW